MPFSTYFTTEDAGYIVTIYLSATRCASITVSVTRAYSEQFEVTELHGSSPRTFGVMLLAMSSRRFKKRPKNTLKAVLTSPVGKLHHI